jgi:hypothetical protein
MSTPDGEPAANAPPPATPGDGQPDPATALFDSWLVGLRLAHTWGWEALAVLSGQRPPDRSRERWLNEAKQALASHMRSPAFLDLMRLHLDAISKSARLFTRPDQE